MLTVKFHRFIDSLGGKTQWMFCNRINMEAQMHNQLRINEKVTSDFEMDHDFSWVLGYSSPVKTASLPILSYLHICVGVLLSTTFAGV